MKSLNRRYLRNIKSNLSFYIAVAFLTALAIVMQIAIAGSYTQEKNYMTELLEKEAVEDGQLVTYLPISDADISELESEYNCRIEKLCSVDTESDSAAGLEIRVMKKTEKVDCCRVTIGNEPEQDNEIMLNAFLHEPEKSGGTGGRGLEVGDQLTLDGKSYTITGFFIRPDYLFCLKDLGDIFSTVHDFGIAVVTDSAFEAFPEEDVSSYYAIRYLSDNEKEVRQALYDTYGIASYTPRSANNRIGTSVDQIEEIGTMQNAILPMVVLLVMALAAVVLGRKVQNERKMIGVLHALGYRKWEIALHYSLFGAIAGILGSILGIAIGIPLVEPMAALCFESKIEPFPISYTLEISTLVTALLLPACGYVLAVFLSALHAMRGSAMDMLRGSSGKKSGHPMRLQGLKAGFAVKYRLRAIFGKVSRTLTVLIGFAIAGMLMVFMLACVDSLEVFVNQSVDEMGSFAYEYVLSAIQTGAPEDGTGCLSASFGVEDHGDQLTLMGMNDNPYMNFVDEDGQTLEMEQGKYYLSDMAAEMYGVTAGDTLTFYNMASLQEYSAEVSGIFRNASMSLLVSDQDTVAELLELPEDSYNVVMSDHELDYTESELVKTVEKESFKDQLEQNVLNSMKQMTAPVLVIGVLICILVIYLMVNMMISENAVSISMLKVLGYHNREVNRIVVYIYHALVPLGIVLGILLGYWLNRWNFINSTEDYNTYIRGVISVKSVLIYAATVIASYAVSMWLLGRKVRKISMVESLKDHRE